MTHSAAASEQSRPRSGLPSSPTRPDLGRSHHHLARAAPRGWLGPRRRPRHLSIHRAGGGELRRLAWTSLLSASPVRARRRRSRLGSLNRASGEPASAAALRRRRPRRACVHQLAGHGAWSASSCSFVDEGRGHPAFMNSQLKRRPRGGGLPGVPPRHVRAIGAGSSPQPWVDPRVTLSPLRGSPLVSSPRVFSAARGGGSRLT